MQTATQTREQALAKHLDIDIEDAEQLLNDGDYLVLTDEEADEQAREYIEQSVWAFNKSFLDAHSEAISELDDESFRVIQERCESANNAIKAMIDDFDAFVDDAIACDGRGHFLASYDFEENEEGQYFIYRVN